MFIMLLLIYNFGMFLLSKAAFNVGMNTFIFIFYRQASAAIFLAPVALFLERKTAPPISLIIFVKIFMLSLVGITMSLNIYGVALKYTTATLAAATTNSLPVITFFLALLFRMEKVNVKTKAGLSKLAGVALCVGGVATIAFYKGPFLKLLLHHHIFNFQLHAHADSSNSNWIKGVFLMLLSNTCWGLWLVIQGRILLSYPSKLLLITIQCFFSAIQSFVIAIIVERNPSEWVLGWNIRLLSVAYCGILVTGVTFYLQAWVVERKGAVFFAMTTPMVLIFTMLSSAFLFGEITTLGSVLGAILLVGGLYCVLWGKKKEQISNSTSNDDLQKERSRSEVNEDMA
ncbi:hypothetical protein Leryth_002014 [Lithospermum erythrorhizon]|nr:hypothetical protein Leryth_002014 [Lithospermum erythrorhizon]